MRFVMGQEDHTTNTSYPNEGPSVFGESSFERSETPSDNIRGNNSRVSAPSQLLGDGTCRESMVDNKKYPASVSIDVLMKAGKLVKPKSKKKVTLTIEEFDVVSQKWRDVTETIASIEQAKFASGGFRDAHHATLINNDFTQKFGNEWVVKYYNAKAVASITGTLESTVEDHCRKQVQMHAVASHITNKFNSKVPADFGKCFKYNHCYYTKINDQPATIEEFVPGSFTKIINNNGIIIPFAEDADDELKQMLQKAECLVHHSHELSNSKFMLLDIQGTGYQLFDPEIATNEVMDEEDEEVYFCCGNCSSVGINAFLASHKCNKYCAMMGLAENKEYIIIN